MSKTPNLVNATVVYTVGDDPAVKKVIVNQVTARWEAVFLFLFSWCPEQGINPERVRIVRVDGFMPSAYEVEHQERLKGGW